jgi:hypothetical protein
MINVIKSVRTRSSGYVAHMGEGSDAHKILVGKHEGKHHLQFLGVDGKIILKRVLKNR